MQERYDYYRRCQALKPNGEQCKAPAVKGQDICGKHAGQRAKIQRAEDQRRDFATRTGQIEDGKDATGILSDGRSVAATIRDLMQTMLDGRLDEDTAGAMLDEIALRQGLLKRF